MPGITPLSRIHHNHVPRAQRNSGSISPSKHVQETATSAFCSSLSALTDLHTRQTSTSAPELPPLPHPTLVPPPGHTTTTTTPTRPPRPSRMPAPATERRGPSSPCAHIPQQLRVSPAQTSMTQTSSTQERERRGKHRKVLWQGTWFGPPLRTQHAPSAADRARELTQSGHEKLGGGGGRRNPPCRGVRLHSAAVALPRTREKATKPQYGRMCRQLPTCQLRHFRTSPPDGRQKGQGQVGARWGACPSGHGRGQRDASNGASAPWSGDGEQDHGEYARDRQDTSLTCTP